MAESPWPTIHAECIALADDLEELSAEEWRTPSLCAGWSVHDVLGHQVAGMTTGLASFLGSLVAAGFSSAKVTAKGVAAHTADGPGATLAEFRRAQTESKTPPGPKDSWLGEALIHAEDIRRPLGIAHDYPSDAVTRAITYAVGNNVFVGGKRRVEGVSLKATDVDWSHGDGPFVEGSAISLLLAVSGRAIAYDDLTGPGLPTLRSR